MKKQILSLLLGGVIAVGSISLPMTVEAATELGSSGWEEWKAETNCTGCSDAHISFSQTTAGSGQIKVTLGISYAAENTKEVIEGLCGGAVYVCENEWTPAAGVGNGKMYYNFQELDSTATAAKYFHEGVEVNEKTELTFDGLTGGKVYYIYCQVCDVHGRETEYGEHYAIYLGSEMPGAAVADTPSGSKPSDSVSDNASSSGGTSSCGGEESAWASYEGKVNGQIKAAQPGSTVVMEKGVSALSNSIMQELLKKGDVSLRLEFTYEDEEYVIIIPAGKALDNDIPWYGPLYLAGQYGNNEKVVALAIPVTAAESKIYEVQRGDSMNKIAAENNITLTELLTKNPDIKNPNKIHVGQKIHL